MTVTVFSGKTRTPFAPVNPLRLDIEITRDSTTEHYGAFDGDRLVGYLKIDSERHDHPQVSETATDPEYRNRGVLRYLINAALDIHGDIWSDDSQSSHARGFWQHMTAVPGPYNRIDAVYPETGESIRATPTNFNDIWNDRTSPVLRIQRVTRSVQEQSYHERTRDWRRKNHRTKSEVFYRPFCHPDENP